MDIRTRFAILFDLSSIVGMSLALIWNYFKPFLKFFILSHVLGWRRCRRRHLLVQKIKFLVDNLVVRFAPLPQAPFLVKNYVVGQKVIYLKSDRELLSICSIHYAIPI